MILAGWGLSGPHPRPHAESPCHRWSFPVLSHLEANRFMMFTHKFSAVALCGLAAVLSGCGGESVDEKFFRDNEHAVKQHMDDVAAEEMVQHKKMLAEEKAKPKPSRREE